jgi:hypothetical protein
MASTLYTQPGYTRHPNEKRTLVSIKQLRHTVQDSLGRANTLTAYYDQAKDSADQYVTVQVRFIRLHRRLPLAATLIMIDEHDADPC